MNYSLFYSVQFTIDEIKRTKTVPEYIKNIVKSHLLEGKHFLIYKKLDLAEKLIFEKLVLMANGSLLKNVLIHLENTKLIIISLIDDVEPTLIKIDLVKKYKFEILDFIEERKERFTDEEYLQSLNLLK